MLSASSPTLELGYPLVDDLQDPGSRLDQTEERHLRLLLALRALSLATTCEGVRREDLPVLEILISRWWMAWSQPLAGEACQYAVRARAEDIAEVCGVVLQDVQVSLARLSAAGLIGLPYQNGTCNDEADPAISLIGLFSPALPKSEPLLLRDLRQRHRTHLGAMAGDYLDALEDEVDLLREFRIDRSDSNSLLKDWEEFVGSPGFESCWAQNPSTGYLWFDKLAQLQDRIETINGYPSDIGSIRKEIGQLQPFRIAILSDRYARKDRPPVGDST